MMKSIPESLFIDPIPQIGRYNSLLGSNFWCEMKTYNDVFFPKHSSALNNYSKKWVSNPFFQWSRQWEYPYTYFQLLNSVREYNAKILDAGSGCTFFPFYLVKHKPWDLHCCDIDNSLNSLYSILNLKEKTHIVFDNCDLGSLEYPSGSFDAIYCISVLEHIASHEKVVDHFKRVLKPNGTLILTFDIVLTPKGIARAKRLLEILEEEFTSIHKLEPLNSSILTSGKVLSTAFFEHKNPNMLPYQGPQKCMLRMLNCLKLPLPSHDQLTVHCTTWKPK